MKKVQRSRTKKTEDQKRKKTTLVLKVEKRKVLGRKVKKLRREGILPANIYGKRVKSQAVQLELKEFLPVYQQVRETGIVELKVKGERKSRPVLIHNVQFHPVTDQPLHADFYQVSLKEKVTANIPLEIVGESPAVSQKLGILVQPLVEVEVEALPTELPDKFEVDVSFLKKVDEMITVADLRPPKGVKILTSPKQVLVKIEPPTKEEAPPPEEKPEEKEEKPAEKEEKAVEKKEEKPAESPSEERTEKEKNRLKKEVKKEPD